MICVFVFLGGHVKKCKFWVARTRVGGGGGGSRARKKTFGKKTHFLFLLPFDPEASETCKTHKNCVLYSYPGDVKHRLSS